MPTQDLTLTLVGSGGDGVVTAGDLLSQAAAQEGLNVIKTEAYGPQIRGGEASCTVRISAKPIRVQGDAVDVLIVFGWADFARFKGEIVLAGDAIVFCEPGDAPPELAAGVVVSPIPFVKLATESAGTKAAKNIVTLGLVSSLFGLPVDTLRRAVANRFGKKKANLLEANLKAFDAGVAAAGTVSFDSASKRLSYVKGEPKLLMSGNEASAVAAMHAGCRFFAGYPITPSSEVLHFLSEWLPRAGGSVIQTEDELAAIGAVIGASFAGVKSMTSTSGPGLSLMTEMLGLSSMAEIPAVIYNVQRGGPSTGLPTKSEQSDLFQSLFGSHGDAPRVVLACEDVESSFHRVVDAFNIAERFQIPVIVQSEQAAAQRRETVSAAAFTHDVVDRIKPSVADLEDYRRYKETADGVSPMSTPGTRGGIYQTNGLEHDEAGRPSSMFLVHERMNAKRYRKLKRIQELYPLFSRFGAEDAEIGILCWGASKGAVEEAVGKANARGEKVAVFVPHILSPFPVKPLKEFLRGLAEVVVVEVSFAAQFYKTLRMLVDLPPGTRLLKRSGGKNLTVAEVDEAIRKAATRVAEPLEVPA